MADGKKQGWLWISCSVFLLLAVARNTGVLGFVLSAPSGMSLVGLKDAVLALFSVACCLALLHEAGRAPLVWLKLKTGPGLPLALGMGLAGTGFLGLGLFFGLSPLAFWTVACCLLCSAVLGRVLVPGSWPRLSDLSPTLPVQAWKAAAFGVLGFCAWHALVRGLAPPTEWDVLAYHLALPKLYLREAKVLELPWMLHSHWPHLMELLYSVPLTLGKDAWPGLFHAGVTTAWILCVFRWASARLGARPAFLGTALLACQPVVLAVAPTAHSDGGQAFFYFLSAATLWRWAEEEGRPGATAWLVLAGLMAGLAASCKLTGLVLAMCLAGWVSLAGPGKRPLERIKSSALFLAGALVFCLPWHAKTAWATGDPFWPFLQAWLGGRSVAMTKTLEATVFWSFPRDLGLILNNGPQFLLVPLLGLGSVALLTGSKPPKELRFLLLASLPYLLVVSRQAECWRFSMACYPALALSAGWFADRLLTAGNWRKWVAVCLVCLGMWPSLSLTQNNELFPLLGLRSRVSPELQPTQAYLTLSLDHYAFFRKASQVLPPGSKTLLFREIRGYYLDADYLWGDPVNQDLIDYHGLDPAGLRARLSELRVTHVLVNEGLGIYGEREGYYDRRVMAVMGTALGSWGKPILKEGGLSLWCLALY
ncbi:MAG: glycosyltransferase family 39 protein [Elusimicrobia bacterium]|nr:glycosyltransferase family 39 protein [Elusimicrobiota bacterium]